MPTPSVDTLLHAAVEALGGTERPGQQEMATAVADAFDKGEHLLVQAGTGTGKSLGYLVPAVLRGERVVVSTATLALQAQLAERDLPTLAEAVRPVLGKPLTFAVQKGRANYVCLHRLAEGVPDEQEALIDVLPTSPLGREVTRAREWARTTATGDRDELVPGISDRAWGQLAVSARECLGAERCPFGSECFAELARERAAAADIVVTNHALLAIDAMHGRSVLPPHDLVVVDEAHDLAARVTSAAAVELSVGMLERVLRRVRPHVEAGAAEPYATAVDDAARVLIMLEPGRLDALPPELAAALIGLRDTARQLVSALGGAAAVARPTLDGGDDGDGDTAESVDAARRQARALATEVFDVAVRLLAADPADVTWVEIRGRDAVLLRVAPLSVAELLRERMFADRTVVLTSATLTVGGTFDAVAHTVGLTDDDEPTAGADPAGGKDGLAWRGIDVGSPFAYERQAILYLARRLPPPGRDGPSEAMLDEVLALLTAAGGRTLGLFSSRRAAELAAAYVRERSEITILCQGEQTLADLGRRFRDEPRTSLFGTLSLWQGIDVPGESCQLVIIDRVPFPRPDDPLMSARARAVDEAGGSGFHVVSVAHAALLLAQGAGRLIRRSTDRGVIAILDPRVVTARYGSYLLRTLPPMWRTTDREVALAALRRLDAAAGARAVVRIEAAGPVV
jgi:ATP-dependent DNA helicase DinG